MRRIRSRDTAPERIVRRYVFAAGLRYRLHRKNLPGRPDLVFASRATVLFVHGCFWHGCPSCVDGTRTVKSNTGYWTEKVRGNQARDLRNRHALEEAGWYVMTIWECETRNPNALERVTAEIKAKPVRR
jgi:DNA mismatch endonuclease (patch repair protein)